MAGHFESMIGNARIQIPGGLVQPRGGADRPSGSPRSDHDVRWTAIDRHGDPDSHRQPALLPANVVNVDAEDRRVLQHLRVSGQRTFHQPRLVHPIAIERAQRWWVACGTLCARSESDAHERAAGRHASHETPGFTADVRPPRQYKGRQQQSHGQPIGPWLDD